MQPVIYVDMLFLLNFFMDSVLLYLSSLVLRRPLKPVRLAAVSAAAALYSVFMFFPRLSFMFSAFAKLLFLTCCCFAAFPTRRPEALLKNSAVIIAVFGAGGGVMLALIFMSSFGTVLGAAVSNGEIYLELGTSELLSGTAVTYAVVYISAYISRRNADLQRNSFETEISIRGKKITVRALSDTGCTLCEPLSGMPVMIIESDEAHKLLPSAFFAAAENGFAIDEKGFLEIYRRIPYRALGSPERTMHGFLPDNIKIGGEEVRGAAVAISDYPLSDGTFNAVFNPELLKFTEVDYENKISVTC